MTRLLSSIDALLSRSYCLGDAFVKKRYQKNEYVNKLICLCSLLMKAADSADWTGTECPKGLLLQILTAGKLFLFCSQFANTLYPGCSGFRSLGQLYPA